MATSTKLHSLNNFPEWEDARKWKAVRTFVKAVQRKSPRLPYPRGMDTRQHDRYYHKFHKDYEVQNERLYYRPKDAAGEYRLNLEIIEPTGNKIQNAIKRIFDDDKKGMWGETMFYWKVCQQYLGITRETTTKFLKHQETYQLTRPYHKKVNHPIQTKCPNAKWMVDCMFLLQYGNQPNLEGKAELKNVYGLNSEYEHRQLDPEMAGELSYLYIFTCVDAYSRKVWAEPMLSHSAEERTTAIRKIMRDANTVPAVIVSDNGGEFKGEFAEFLRANNIYHITTTSYSPWGNGIVERMNKSLRDKIRQGFVRHGRTGSLEWVKYLHDYCDNINNSRSTKFNVTPNQLWTPGYNPPRANAVPDWAMGELVEDTSALRTVRANFQTKRIELNHEQLQRRPPNVFNVGDLVRIANESLFSHSRERRKTDMETKYNAINYSPEIFEITHIIGRKPAPNQNLQQMGIKAWDIREQMYVVKHLEAPQTVLKKHFHGSELMKVPAATTFTDISQPRAEQLNRFRKYE